MLNTSFAALFAQIDDELLERPDVQDFIHRIEMEIAAKLELGGPSPRKVRPSAKRNHAATTAI